MHIDSWEGIASASETGLLILDDFEKNLEQAKIGTITSWRCRAHLTEGLLRSAIASAAITTLFTPAIVPIFWSIVAVGSLAQTGPSVPPPEEDPFVGTWHANRDKSRPKLNKRDSSYLRTIFRDKDERVWSSRTADPRDNRKFIENRYRIRCDGTPQLVRCGELSCTTTCTYKGANLVEGETESADGRHDYWTEEVSLDGTEMRTRGYTDRARQKLKSTWVLDRVK